jgi:AAA family ATP:ADP antiporter
VSGAAPTNPDTRVERLALIYAAAGCFCLLGGYYILRPIRDALALEVGVRNNFVLFSIVFAVTAAILPVYWWFVRRTPRARLVWMVNVTFAGIFFALALGLYALPRDRLLASVYFVALTSTNFLLVAVFWSAMSDVWRPELAKRFYGYVAAGGSAGAIAGNVTVRAFVVDTGLPPLIIIAAFMVIAAAALVSTSRATLRRCAGGAAVPDGAMPVGGRALDDLARLATSPYLLGIVGIIVIGQTIGAFMYNEQGKYIAAAYANVGDRAAMFATMEIAVNLLSLFFQAVVVTWLTRRGSVAWSLSAMPLLLGASFVVLALFPVGGVLLVTQVMRRAADYGLGKPPREMLFTVLNPESKFKSKSVIDILLHRGSDAVAQWVYLPFATLGLAGISWICAGFCVALLGATTYLGRAFEQRRAAEATTTVRGS